MVYIVFIILALIFSCIFDHRKGYSRAKNTAYWCLCLYLICMSGFSYGLGGDKWAYMGYFETYYDQLDAIWDCIEHEFIKMGFMPLWTLTSLVIKSTTDSFYVLQFFVSTIVCTTVCAVAKRHTQYGFLFLLLFFLSETYFQFNTEVLREGISIALGLWAVENYQNGKKVTFYILVSFAILFHISSVALLLYPWCTISLNRRNVLLILMAAFGGWLLGDVILKEIIRQGVVGDALATKFATYTRVRFNFFGFVRHFLQYLALPLIAIYFNRTLTVSVHERTYREKMYAFFTFLGIVGCAFPGFLRFMNYVQIFVLLTYVEFVVHLLEQKRHFIIRLATVVMAIGLNIWYDFSYWPKVDFYFYQFFIPYTNILDEEADMPDREAAYLEATDYNSFCDDIE